MFFSTIAPSYPLEIAEWHGWDSFFLLDWTSETREGQLTHLGTGVKPFGRGKAQSGQSFRIHLHGVGHTPVIRVGRWPGKAAVIIAKRGDLVMRRHIHDPWNRLD
jgi:hypothetical protein